MNSVVSGATSFSVSAMVRRQRDRGHHRAEVRAADADVDDVGDLLAGGAGDRSLTDAGRKAPHGLEDVLDGLPDPLTVCFEAVLYMGAERDMQHAAVFGGVDAGAGEHGVASRLDTDRFRIGQKRGKVVRGPRAFREIEKKIVVPERELGEPVTIGLKQRPDTRLDGGGASCRDLIECDVGERLLFVHALESVAEPVPDTGAGKSR